MADERARAVHEHGVEVHARQRTAGAASDARGDRARELVHQLLLALAELGRAQRQGEQAHAAVDVVADAAWRDDAIGKRGRGHGADGKAVALVDIGHRDRGVDDAGKRRHVLQLLQRVVPGYRIEQLAVGEDPCRHAHVRSCRRR